MLSFFRTSNQHLIVVEHHNQFSGEDIKKLCWLFSDAEALEATSTEGIFVDLAEKWSLHGAQTPWKSHKTWDFQALAV